MSNLSNSSSIDDSSVGNIEGGSSGVDANNQAVTTEMPIADGAQATGESVDLEAKWVRWKCLVCGYTYEGREPLLKCPRCGNADPDKFGDE